MSLIDSSKREAKREKALLKEEMDRACARKNFVEFCNYMVPEEPPALHHRLLCNLLEKVSEGKIRRLMVFMPPGMAKSSYSSIRFPAYYLGKYPKKNIICASYGEGLASGFGRKVRNMVSSREYRNLFETRLAEDSRAKGEWNTADGGSYFAAGVGSGITGRRADFGLIDDPVKGQKDADSELVRNECWAWYKSDFFTRLKPGAAQCIVQTRWSDDDLSGRILPDDWDGESGDFIGFDGQIWKVICIPAEAEENDALGRKKGQWLWTDYCPEEEWSQVKNVQTENGMNFRIWNCLYQQRPQPDTGTFFKRDWFKRYKLGEEPLLSMYGASDYAVSEGKGDFTEHGVGGFDKHDNLYFTDWWSGQSTPDTWIKEQLRLAKEWKPFVWLAEVGVIRRAVESPINKAKQSSKTYFRQEWLPHIGDKAANAKGFQWIASCGKVFIPHCEWGDDLLNQLVKFIPNTNFKDDKVDVCGLFGRILDQTYSPTEPSKEEEKPEKDSYGFDEPIEKAWKTN